MLFVEDSAPPAFFAAKWIPIVISVLVASGISWMYVLYYRSREHGRSWLVWCSVAFSLTVSALVLVLTPIDVYAVSSMKTRQGQFQPWASINSTRQHLLDRMMHMYYFLYSMIFFVAFFLLPFAYFFTRDLGGPPPLDGTEPGARQRARSAVKYTLGSVLVMALLITIGLLLPALPAGVGGSNSTFNVDSNQMFPDVGSDPFISDPALQSNGGLDVISILLYSMSLVGMLVMVGYTGLGLSLWPIRLLRGWEGLEEQLEDVRYQRVSLQAAMSNLRDQVSYSTFPSWQTTRLAELETQEEQLIEREQRIAASMNSLFHRCSNYVRPVELVLGLTVIVVGAVIFTSLLLTNIDKALHSLGMRTGYLLPRRMLPNPVDWLLVETDRVYPLDYLFYLLVVFTLVGATVTCLQDVGIRICAFKLYSVKPGRTAPHGLILLAMTLVYVLVTLNVLLMSIAPHYSMYGDQRYQVNHNTSHGIVITHALPCTSDAPRGQCVLSRMAVLLLNFSYRAWIFGAVFYWSTWFFLASVVIGFVVAVFRRRTVAPVYHTGSPSDTDRLLGAPTNA